MTTSLQETPAATGDLTTIRFCGVNFILETLDNDRFEQLYDAIIDHGSDLVERFDTLPYHLQVARKDQYRKQLAENSQHLVLLEREAERRKTLPASTGPQLCPECSQLSQPIDPNELCDNCIEVCNDFEGDRYIEPEFIAA